MPKDRWDSEIFHKNGKPKKKLSPAGWFAYCVKKAGSVNALARQMGVTKQTVHQSWGGVFPDKYVVLAEKEFGVPRQLLAPHLYE